MQYDPVQDLSTEIVEHKKTAKKKIQDYIKSDRNGPYVHNVIGLTLANFATKCGVKYANELVKELKLIKLYNIHPVEEKNA